MSCATSQIFTNIQFIYSILILSIPWSGMWSNMKFSRIKSVLSTCSKRYISKKGRKYPVDPKHVEKLPVFQYTVSKKNYRRVFAWGNLETGALGVPYVENNKNKDIIRCLSFPRRITFGEQFEVVSAACGFGFTIYGVNSDTNIKIYGTGINTDSQIGYHEVRQYKPLGIIFRPQPIPLPFLNPEKTKILKLAAGRAHSVVLTDEGIFTLGNNSYGQCGRKVIPNEDYSMSNYIHHISKLEGKNIVDIECGQDHSLALTEDGNVYSCGWGADGQTGLNHFDNVEQFTRVKGDIENEKIVKLACKADFTLALNDKGDVFGWGNTEYNQITLPGGDQQLSVPSYIDMLKKIGKITSIASSGTLCIVVNEQGHVYSWGYGLLGVGPNIQQSKLPIKIPETLFGLNDFQPNNIVQKVVCGLNYAVAVTNGGDLFAWGRNKHGCLGLGGDKDQYFPLKVSLGGHVDEIFCGADHSVTICKPYI
ncbi:RCC1-like G exchanging factor-like protein isoform X2 [Anoplophora glabripennis]|uniref:RCC1-like G exchanging factor-like protein isoform X2 n=1 Tax=Anoplophora glabripennis TaxID=217634 RepID=UPI0008736F05|nr:RCC1-like G exchanging factor-like protein isoform X2 [Anoplophora glabripennis]